jgi:hypothetical protein
MIRILTLLVSLFTFGLVDLAEITYEIPVTDMLYFNDTPIDELNGLSLNELFIDGNLLTNGDFSNGLTNWFTVVVNTTLDVIDQSIVIYSAGSGQFRLYQSIVSHDIGDVLYFSYDVSVLTGTISNWTYLNAVTNNRQFLVSVNNFTGRYTNYFTATTSNNGIFIGTTSPQAFDILQIDNVNFLNLTDLGLTSLTKTQLDRYYELWLNPELNITYEINELDTQDLIILLASQSVWTIMIHLLYKYAYRPKKKSKRLGM